MWFSLQFHLWFFKVSINRGGNPQPLAETRNDFVAALVLPLERAQLAVRELGPNSIEKFWLEFQLKKPLEFRLEIPYTKTKFKKWV